MTIVEVLILVFLIIVLVLNAIILSKLNHNAENYRGCTKDGVTLCRLCKGAGNCHDAGCTVNSNNECVNE